MINLRRVMPVKSPIKLLIMDADGTLTDGKIYMSGSGEMLKAFDIKDGYGIKDMLPLYGIVPVILTARGSDIIKRRCEELNIENLYQNCSNKAQKLHSIAKQFGISCDSDGVYWEIAYIGDDIPDLECMRHCGVKGCPFDAVSSVKEKSDFISSKNGGNGAVRDFIEYILRQQGMLK